MLNESPDNKKPLYILGKTEEKQERYPPRMYGIWERFCVLPSDYVTTRKAKTKT